VSLNRTTGIDNNRKLVLKVSFRIFVVEFISEHLLVSEEYKKMKLYNPMFLMWLFRVHVKIVKNGQVRFGSVSAI
jgi:hypothetical protein